MSDMHDTRRLHGGGAEREPDVAKPAPAPVRTQTVFDMGDHSRLWQRLTDLGKEIEDARTFSIIISFAFALVVSVSTIFLIWRKEVNVEERLAAQQKFNEAYKNAIDRKLELVASENRHAINKQTDELRLKLDGLAADAEKGRKTIADLDVKLKELPKHPDVVIQDPPEQESEKAADVPVWPPKSSTLAELRQYDGERIFSHHICIDGTCFILVDHLPYAYGDRVLVQLFLSCDDFETAVFDGNGVLNVQALEDAHRNR